MYHSKLYTQVGHCRSRSRCRRSTTRDGDRVRAQSRHDRVEFRAARPDAIYTLGAAGRCYSYTYRSAHLGVRVLL